MRWMLLMTLMLGGLARGADPGPGAEPSVAPQTEPTPAELEALQKALGQDAATPGPAPSNPIAAAVQSMNPDLSLIFDGSLSWFSDEAPDQRGGHDPNKTGFGFNQLELHAGASVDPFFRFDANIVFAQFGVEVEEAYATSLGLPAGLQLRAGQFLTRFGRKNPTHPHQWAFLDQPLAFGKFFGSEGSRGLGVELSWLTPLPWYAEVVVSASEAGGECCARSFLGANDTGVHGLGDFLYTMALKQFWDLGPDWGLSFGLSAQLGPSSSGHGNRAMLLGADLFLRWRPRGGPGRTSVDLTVEALARGRELPDRVVWDGGGYAELRWAIDAEWAIAARHELVTGLEDDPLDPTWTETRQRTALALDFLPSHFSRLRLQLGRDQNPARDEVGWMAMLGLEVAIGAHGAHAY
ncbi:MAG: zinc-regulated TonB-dependent outer membrane receptor [Deltaproteobacteria bacterium]|nr:zinc-regulated TonB-dependent outer membrane receptor [Deltaproteobacteria bacterium]